MMTIGQTNPIGAYLVFAYGPTMTRQHAGHAVIMDSQIMVTKIRARVRMLSLAQRMAA